MRELAPILTGKYIIPAMETALSNNTMLEYRLTGSRKHTAVDTFSMSIVLNAFKRLKPATQDKYLAKFGKNPGTFTTTLLNIINK